MNQEQLEADNAALRAEVERLKDSLLTAHSAKREYLARIETIGDALCGTERPRSHTDILTKATQLRARVAELEQALRMAAIEAHKVRELEQDKARLVEVAHDAVSYVGAANYRERQEEAHEMIDSACAEERQT